MDFLEKIISNFMRKYSKDIDIHLSPNLVTLSQKNRTIQAEPILYIDDRGKKPKILGWSRSIQPGDNCIRINIFNRKEYENNPMLNQKDCLLGFFQIAIRELVVESSIVRPIIRVHDLDDLPNQNNTNIKATLDHVLMECGAWKVEHVCK